MPAGPPDLLIVYNANGGPFAMLADALHKVLSPATYPCSLCAVTYGPVAMRGAWREFLDRLPTPSASITVTISLAIFRGSGWPSRRS